MSRKRSFKGECPIHASSQNLIFLPHPTEKPTFNLNLLRKDCICFQTPEPWEAFESLVCQGPSKLNLSTKDLLQKRIYLLIESPIPFHQKTSIVAFEIFYAKTSTFFSFNGIFPVNKTKMLRLWVPLPEKVFQLKSLFLPKRDIVASNLLVFSPFFQEPRSKLKLICIFPPKEVPSILWG